MEVRRGDDKGDAASIERGGERLRFLAHAVAAQPGDPDRRPTAERCGLLGSAWKRRAAILIRDGKLFDGELKAARDWYARGEGDPDTPEFSPYCALNRLMLDALVNGTADPAMARKAGTAARERFQVSRD